MSKTATARALRASGPEPAIVRSVRSLEAQVRTLAETAGRLRDSLEQLPAPTPPEATASLDQTIRALRSDLASLPDAIARETAAGLAPLEQLRTEVRRVLAAYDQVTAAQRQSLDALADEVSRTATDAFETRVQSLDTTLKRLSGRLEGLQGPLEALRRAETLPARLEASESLLTASGEEFVRKAAAIRTPLWRQAAGVMLAGVVAGAVVLTGHGVFERLVPPDAVQRNAEWAQRVWSHATERERALLQEIAARKRER